MLNLFWLPLEQLERRYTVGTRKIYKREFYSLTDNVLAIDPTYSGGSLGTGNFLHPAGTSRYKAEQVAMVARMFSEGVVRDGDVFFLDDVWFPGIQSILYMARMMSVRVRVYGVLHAGSHTPTDDVACIVSGNNSREWVRLFERSFLDICDGVFVGSAFHKKELEEYHGKTFSNVHVTRLAFDKWDIPRTMARPWAEREKLVVFPHRLHWEKCPQIFAALAAVSPGYTFVRTHEMNLSKDAYYELLSRARMVFSAALQENFGYAMLEAAAMGCNVVVPDRLAYREMYPDLCRYESVADVFLRLRGYLEEEQVWDRAALLDDCSMGVTRMVDIMRREGWV